MADNTQLNVTTGGDTVRDIDRSGVKTQVVALDAGGAAGESLVTSTNPMPTSINAVNFVFSTVNSSTTQLASNATFTGTPETALNQPSISLLMTSDQPMTLTVNQYIDAGGTQAVPPIVFNVAASVGFSGSFVLNGNYIKLTAKNVGTATTTTFSLNTAYGTIPSGDEQGRTPVASADCVQLLSTTISAAGASTAIDTKNFSAVVVQPTGPWAGQFIFEGSNDTLTWSTVPAFGHSSTGLQDVISANGIYSVRPAARYLRINTLAITGTMTVSAIGRSDVGVSAADYLSLALDSKNQTPMNVSLAGTKQDVQGAIVLADASGPIFGSSGNNAPIGTVLFTVDTTGYQSISIQTRDVSSIAVMGYGSNTLSGNSADWVPISGLYSSQGSSTTTTITAGSNGATASFNSVNVVFQFPCVCRYFRFATISQSGPLTVVAYLRNTPCTAATAINTGLAFLPGNSMTNLSYAPVMGRARTTLSSSLADNVGAPFGFTNSGALIVEKHAPSELTWGYAAAASGILNTTTAVTFKAAVASQRGNISAVQINAEALGAATELAIRDGAAGTVLWRIKIPTAGLSQQQFTFDPPLRQAAVNTLLEVVTLTASVTGAVYFNAQGFMTN